MATIETRLEMRGMPRREIIMHFSSLPGINIVQELFVGHNWQVEVCEETMIELGAITIPATMLIFSGNKEKVEQIIAELRLKFLSAGG